MSSLSGATGANNSLKGTGYKQAQLQQFTPEQMQLFQQAFSHVGPNSYLSKLASGDEATFNQIEAPALRQFGELQGNLASRFSGAGSFGARKSSGFQNTMGAASSELSEKLASNRQSLQQQAIKDLMSLSGDLLQQKPYENFLTPEKKKKPWWQSVTDIGLPVIGATAGGYFGGPAGAAAGFNVGNSVAGSISGRDTGSIDWSGISKLPTKWGK